MTSKKSHPYLPQDIILSIIDFIAPSRANAKIAYGPSHTITRTFLALTRTSRTIYPASRRLLYTHCLYIDSPHRLRCVLTSLTAFAADSTAAHSSLTQNPATFPHDTSLYLTPFLDDTINDLPTAQAVHDLLSLLAPTLRRLVIDIPLRSLYPADDSLGVRPILRKAFTQFTSLELFCSARDELFLSCSSERLTIGGEENVWSLWPNLKTLALYNCDIDSDRFWCDLGVMQSLDTLVLTRADGLQEVDFRSQWRRYGNGKKNLTAWFVDVDDGHGIPETIEEPKEGDKVKIMVGRVPTSYYGDEDVIELCQDWIKRSALRGETGFQEELMHLSS